MRGKIGLAVMLLAVAVFVLAESSSYGGHRRRGNCGSCGSACASGSCETASAAPAEASPSDATAHAAPPAPAKGAAVNPPAETPQAAKSTASGPSNQANYSARRARRGWRR